jgi:hypothetical protein
VPNGVSCPKGVAESLTAPSSYLHCLWLFQDLQSYTKVAVIAWLFCSKHFLTTGSFIAAMRRRYFSLSVKDREIGTQLDDLPKVTQLLRGRAGSSIRYLRGGYVSAQAVQEP